MGASWLSPNWGFRKKISIQNTNVDSNLTDFPLYVPINADADFHEARGDGFDIRFTSSNGVTLLKYERESWSGGGGAAATANIWTKCNPLAGSQQEIYCYYGYAAAGDGQDANNVWDGNFHSVFHLIEAGDGTAGEYIDSTGNGHDGQGGAGVGANVPDQVAAKIYNGQDFVAANPDFIDIGDTLDSQVTFTIGFWYKPDDVTRDNSLITKGAIGANEPLAIWRDEFAGGDRFACLITDDDADYSGARFSTNGSAAGAGTWQHVVITFNGNDELNFYIDGSPDANNPHDMTGIDEVQSNIHTVRFGSDRVALAALSLDGVLDEFRISNTERTAAWTKFEHANVNEGDNELTWGAEEKRPTGMSPSIFHPVF
jgi:hypothetical protein